MFCGSKTALVNSNAEFWTQCISLVETTGAKEDNMKWILGYGTKLVWNSFKSTFKEPENLKLVVKLETT
ncbi:hypothetical protein D3C80_2098320 [compost metagenome]